MADPETPESFVEKHFPVRFPEYLIGGTKFRPKGWTKLESNMYNPLRHRARHYVLCGGKNNIVVVDLDRLKEGESAQGKKDGVDWLKAQFPDPQHPVWQTFTAKTKSNGLHLYYRGDPDIRSAACVIAGDPTVKIDTRGYKKSGEPSGCIAAPLSPGYEILNMVAPVPLPSALKSLLVTHSQPRARIGRGRPPKDAADGELIDDVPEVSEVSGPFAQIVKALVGQHFPEYHDSVDVDKVFRQNFTYLVPLRTRYCKIKGGEHQSNHPYIVLKASSIVVRCHDEDCRSSPVEVSHNVSLAELFEGFKKVQRDEELSMEACLDLYAEEGEIQAFEYLNQYFCKVTHESTVFFCSRDSAAKPWLLRDKSALLEAFEHYCVDVTEERKQRKIPILTLWTRYKGLRTFKNIVFEPKVDGDKDGEFINLFRGFKAKKLEEGEYEVSEIQMLLDHQLIVISNNDQAFYDYVVKWQAYALQRREKTTTLMGFNGKQGTGKSKIWEFFGEKIVGDDHYYYCNNMDDFTGQFTGHLAAKLFCLLDEVTYAGGFKVNSKLKSLVTQPKQKLEKKGKDAVSILNHMNMVALSNDNNFLKVEPSDRRYAVQTCSDARLGDRDYFNRLQALIDDPHIADVYYTYLLGIDLNGFVPANLPQTEARTDLMYLCMNNIERFVDALLDHRVDDYRTGEVYEKVNMRDLFEVYRYWCNMENLQPDSNGRMDTKVFSKTLKNSMPKKKNRAERLTLTYHGNGQSLYTLDLTE